MASSTPPRRRASPAVYRRRRLVVLLALVAVVALVWLFIAQPWRGAAADGTEKAAAGPTLTPTQTTLPISDGEASPTPTATPHTAVTASATPTTKPTPSTTAASAPTCKSGDLLVEPVTDKESYKSGQKPKLSIALTNTGDSDCTVNVGTSTQKFVISSGGDTWWRSTDCQSTPSDQIVLLAAGQRVTSATPLVWDRTRSSVKTCTSADRQKAPGGGASYHLGVEIGGVSSDSTQQFLLY